MKKINTGTPQPTKVKKSAVSKYEIPNSNGQTEVYANHYTNGIQDNTWGMGKIKNGASSYEAYKAYWQNKKKHTGK